MEAEFFALSECAPVMIKELDNTHQDMGRVFQPIYSLFFNKFRGV